MNYKDFYIFVISIMQLFSIVNYIVKNFDVKLKETILQY